MSVTRDLWPVVGKPRHWGSWPGWRYDLALVAFYAPDLAAAHAEAYPNLEQVVRRILEPHDRGDVAKAIPKQPHRHANTTSMRAALAAQIHLDPDALLSVLRDIYGDAYLAGAHAAMVALEEEGLHGATMISGLGGLDSGIGWDAWEPGYAEAANEIAGVLGGRGLDVLLSNASVEIAGITGTDLDRMATILADGVAAGEPVDRIARDVLDLVGSTNRAEMIAWTETARAMSVASLDTYRANGIGQWDWLTSPGACPECESQEAQNPHGLSDDPPPGHPRCRCAASPVVYVDAALVGSADAADLADTAETNAEAGL